MQSRKFYASCEIVIYGLINCSATAVTRIKYRSSHSGGHTGGGKRAKKSNKLRHCGLNNLKNSSFTVVDITRTIFLSSGNKCHDRPAVG